MPIIIKKNNKNKSKLCEQNASLVKHLKLGAKNMTNFP